MSIGPPAADIFVAPPVAHRKFSSETLLKLYRN